MRTVDALRTLEAATVSQRGLITSNQAVQLGIDRTTLSRLASSGDVVVVRRGVYALPSASADPFSDARAAWLASAPSLFADQRVGSSETPVLSHSSAAAIHGIGSLLPNRHTLTTRARKQSRQTDIRYVIAPLSDTDVDVVAGLNVTSASRTIGDLSAGNTDIAHVAELVHDALGKSLTSPEALASALHATSHRFGHSSGESLLSACIQITGLPQPILDTIQSIIHIPAIEKNPAVTQARTLALRSTTLPNPLAAKIRAMSSASETLVKQLRLAKLSSTFPGAEQIAAILEGVMRSHQATKHHLDAANRLVQRAIHQTSPVQELQQRISALNTVNYGDLSPSSSLRTETEDYLGSES